MSRCHTHTKQQTENKQERQMDKQMGKDGKLTRATELGYICWWRWTPWAEAPRGHSGTFPSALQRWLQGRGAGTSCKSSSPTPALRGSLCTLVFDSKRLPEPWTLHQLCVGAVSAREGLFSFASCRSEEQTLSPHLWSFP